MNFLRSSLFLSLAWTSTELFVLLSLQWAYLLLSGKEKKKILPLLSFSLTILIFSIWLRSGGGAVIANWIDSSGDLNRWHSTLIWNIFCTIWAMIEGLYVIYVGSIYRLMRKAPMKKDGKKGDLQVGAFLMKGLIVLFFVCLWISYHQLAFEIFRNHVLSKHEIVRVMFFYRRVTGVFWIAFEWAVAIYVIKALFLMRRVSREGVTGG